MNADEHRLGNPLPQRIAVVRALPGLGDLLCIIPAMRALRAALPATNITLIGLPGAHSFVERFKCYFDELLEFPGYPGVPERELDHDRLLSFLAQAQARRFDLALQLHGSGLITNPFTVLLGARLNAGCYLPGQYCPDPERFLPYPAHEPEIWRHLRLIAHLGIPLHGDELEFPLGAADFAALETLGAPAGLQVGDYVCVHPGATAPARRWPPELFAEVADGLAAQGLQIVLTGTAGEAALTQAVAAAMRAPAIDLAGRTSLGQLGALLARARLLVCNDTGVSHLAAALKTPSVVIFMASDPGRWAPLDGQRHRATGQPPADNTCHHCSCVREHRCLRDGCSALRNIPRYEHLPPATAEAVLAQALALAQLPAAGRRNIYAA